MSSPEQTERERAEAKRLARAEQLTTLGVPEVLWRFVGSDGVLDTWPARKQVAAREAALDYLAALFDDEPVNEREVNRRLRTRHSFDDPALLRRELFDSGRLSREIDGSAYWRSPSSEPKTS